MGNFEEISCPVQKQNILEAKNDLASGHLRSELGSVAQNCQTVESSTLEQNPPNEKHEMGSNHVSEPMTFRTVGSDHTSENPIMDENARGKTELPPRCVIGELVETRSAGSNADQTLNLCDIKLGSDNVQCEPVEREVVGSNSTDDGKSSSSMIINSAAPDNQTTEPKVAESNAQNFQTLDSPLETTVMRSNSVDVGLSVEKLTTDSEHVSSEHLGIRTVGSDAEKSHIKVMQENKPEGKPEDDLKLVHDEAKETNTAECDVQKIQTIEFHSERQKVPTEIQIVGSDSFDAGLSSIPPRHATENSDWTGHKETTVSLKPTKRKSGLNCTLVTSRALRPRVNGLCKTPEPVNTVNANISGEQEKRKKRKRTINALDDEFSRARKRLRYFLSRMGYEHNFIEAYSGEGWKGQSAEKIRPEKELERASSQILQCKRKIRELFQNLDSSCAEGRFQESLFDSDGLISSDDIFCAKCGSKDVSADNDIILCDGICDRGFHQMCLKPPLLKEEIPPGDEGWLCPGCDCKLDCIDLLNDSQGTDLSMDDAWELVFPEAAATIVEEMIDEIAGLPSDDSEDNEYNPDASDGDDEVNSESSSSEDSENSENSNDSDSTSVSDDLVARPVDDHIMGLPSDDSEDDEYDPNVPDPEQTKDGGSSSDSASASEYFSASSDANESSGAEDDPSPSSIDGSKLPGRKTRSSKMDSNKNQSVNSELLQILESNSQGDSAPVVGRRQRERLDYKKLHDEEYGNAPTDSSDDEDYFDMDAPQKKDDSIRRDTKSGRRNSEETGSTSRRKTRTKKDTEVEMEIDSPGPELAEKETTTPTSKALGQAGKEKLQESFKENNYPTRDTKEKLAKDLGITFKQVSKWFEHARRHARHRTNSAKSKNTTKVSGTNQIVESSEETASKVVGKTLSNGVEVFKEEEAPTSKVENAEPETQVVEEAPTSKVENAEPETQVVEEAPTSKVKYAEKVVVEQETELSPRKSLRSGRDVSAAGTSTTPSKEDREVVLSLTATKCGQVQTRNQKVSSQIQTRSRPKRKR